MKTKQVPAIVMLLAGLLTCVISIVQHMEFGKFVKTLFIVVICFYILGCIQFLHNACCDLWFR